MMLRRVLAALLLCLTSTPAWSQAWFMHGRVTMEDGTAPPKPVSIERYCGPNRVTREALTDRTGQFLIRRNVDPLNIAGFDVALAGMTASTIMRVCVLRATLADYESNTIDLATLSPTADPNLPPLVLRRGRPESTFDLYTSARVPGSARRSWERAVKDTQTRNWAGAERDLHAALKAAPQFAQAWHMLGIVCQNQQKPAEAREAYQKAIDADPKTLAPRVLLTRIAVQTGEWETARRAGEALIAADSKHRYPEAFLHHAVACYRLRDFEAAEKSAREALRLDRKRQMPRAEYVLGLVLAGKRDYTAAAAHMRQYLEMEPHASDSAAVRARISKLGTPEGDQPPAELGSVVLDVSLGGEAWIPGGLKTLAAVARIPGSPPASRFFEEYCAALVRHGTPTSGAGLPGYLEGVRTYFAVAAEMVSAARRHEDGYTLRLSAAAGENRKLASRVLPMLGWKLTETEDAISVEPGDRPADGPRQAIVPAFGVDELVMRETLQTGGALEIPIPAESARLMGGEAWSALVNRAEPLPGGIAEAFARDLRMAKVYTALSTMGAETAAALVRGVGLRTLVERCSELASRSGGVLVVHDGAVAVPGGAPAEQTWTRLAGVSPRNAPGFLRALFENGALGLFYISIGRADTGHQAFFAASAPRAAKIFDWYRRSSVQNGAVRPAEVWNVFFSNLPLDSGHVRFPGGRAVWAGGSANDEDALVSLGSPDILMAFAALERNRGVPLDEASASLLLERFKEWRSLFGYFDALPGLGAAEFRALASFSDEARKLDPAPRHTLLGEFHALAALAVLGTRAGSLDASAGAAAFRRACDLARGPRNPARALNELSAIAGAAGDLDEAVRTTLLRLSPERRVRFDRLLDQQKIPRLEAARRKGDEAAACLALTGLVYAGAVDPDSLVASEDPDLVRKHRFTELGSLANVSPLFLPSQFSASSVAPGSLFTGGFAGFPELARSLSPGGGVLLPAAAESGPPQAGGLPAPAVAAVPIPVTADVFRADARLVEVYATVTDARGRYIDGLPQAQFHVVEEGSEQPVAAFESHFAGISCALLLDTTGSMRPALPALKNAALKLISELRPDDSVAVYGFGETVTLLQPFTTDKSAAMRAVLRTYPDGRTSLYDAVARVSRDIAGRTGKKAIVVFTDGADNMSTLPADTAIRRAKMVGAPVYSIAQGTALDSPALLKQLEAISSATGGLAFIIRNEGEIRRVFESVASDLMHGYLLAFRPNPGEGAAWRRIQVQVRGPRAYNVRAREGYYP